jgi:hypothetical protein
MTLRFFSQPRKKTFSTISANNVKNITDARYRNALGGIEHLAKYRFM